MCQVLGTGNTVLNTIEIHNFMEFMSCNDFSLHFFFFTLAFLKLKNHPQKVHKS